MFSILIPSYNNLEYLKICIDSIKKNSNFNHQIIIHVNEGTDGTLEYIKENNLEFTFSNENIGMPRALNLASKKARFNYIVISHDDFYYCPNWDKILVDEVSIIGHQHFYLSGTEVGAIKENILKANSFPPKYNAGLTPDEFNEKKLLDNIDQIKVHNFQGSTKCPGLVHKDIWNKVGGWSEEFSPTGGDDSDFAMKLWNLNIRIFKGMGSSLVYHFGSVTTRKKNKDLNTYLGSRGNKIFLLKWKIGINFFEKFYLKAGPEIKKNNLILRYDGPLNEPHKDFWYFILLFKEKVLLIYLKFSLFIRNEKKK